ncbi:Calcium-dependent protein kinase 11 [Senna tora]|uniref:Calcium-dependent protein kinase 11 n=1 Tax=Senna tora TaxID=362788 RepID=A0A834TDS2_9FABA|nr:Calcium-dependent protein kinase 11 [Senna tora]
MLQARQYCRIQRRRVCPWISGCRGTWCRIGLALVSCRGGSDLGVSRFDRAERKRCLLERDLRVSFASSFQSSIQEYILHSIKQTTRAGINILIASPPYLLIQHLSSSLQPSNPNKQSVNSDYRQTDSIPRLIPENPLLFFSRETNINPKKNRTEQSISKESQSIKHRPAKDGGEGSEVVGLGLLILRLLGVDDVNSRSRRNGGIDDLGSGISHNSDGKEKEQR